jgi:hypothetical protein
MAKGEILSWLCSDDLGATYVVTGGQTINPARNRHIIVGRSLWIDRDGAILNHHPFSIA